MARRKQLRLNNLLNMRRTIGSLAREFYKNYDELEQDNTWWRTLGIYLDLSVKAAKLEKETELEKRIEAIENELERQGRNGDFV